MWKAVGYEFRSLRFCLPRQMLRHKQVQSVVKTNEDNRQEGKRYKIIIEIVFCTCWERLLYYL